MTNYSPQPGDVVIPGAQAVTELGSRVGGFIAGCGQAGLAVISGLVNGTPVSPGAVTAIIQDSISHGASSAGGTSTPSELAATAPDYGFTLQSVPWRQALQQDAGVTPILLGVSNASAFGGADSNVQGHYITVLGRTSGGNFIVNDPNTAASTQGGFVVYTAQQIANANPFSAQTPGGTVAGATFPGLSGAASTVGGVASSVPQAIGQFGQTVTSDLTTGLRLVGWMVIGLTIIGAGLWLLLSPQQKQTVTNLLPGKGAADDVAKAASGGAQSGGDDASSGAEGAEAAEGGEGAELADAAVLA